MKSCHEPQKAPKLRGWKWRAASVIAPPLAAWFVRLLHASARKTLIHGEILQEHLQNRAPFILSCWHNRGIMVLPHYLASCKKTRRLFLAASYSRDGVLASYALTRLGIGCIFGSSSKGGTRVLIELVKRLRQGHDVAFAPDGPHGPMYTVKDGVLAASKMTGAPILPVAADAHRKICLKSWDRLIVPKPVTRINFVCGEPFVVPKEATETQMQGFRDRLESELNRIGEIATNFSAPPKDN